MIKTRKEFIEKARAAGLLEPGLRLGLINPVPLIHEEVRTFFQHNKQYEGVMMAITNASEKFRLSEGYVKKIVYNEV